MLSALAEGLSRLAWGLDLALHPVYWLTVAALVSASMAVIGAIAVGRWSETPRRRMARVEIAWTSFTALLVIGLATSSLGSSRSGNAFAGARPVERIVLALADGVGAETNDAADEGAADDADGEAADETPADPSADPTSQGVYAPDGGQPYAPADGDTTVPRDDPPAAEGSVVE